MSNLFLSVLTIFFVLLSCLGSFFFFFFFLAYGKRRAEIRSSTSQWSIRAERRMFSCGGAYFLLLQVQLASVVFYFFMGCPFHWFS